MSAAEFAIRSRHVVTRRGVKDALVVVRNGRIAAILPPATSPGARDLIDVGESWLLPGIVDPHVHVNEPGRTEWEGFATATAAAAAGGVTTVVDMPLNSVPATTTADGLRAKLAAAAGQCQVDVGFWGGVVPGNAGDLAELAAAGALGFKCFLCPSGVEEFHHVGEADLRQAMPIIARLGLPLLVHAELPGPLDRALAGLRDHDPRRHATWLASRPREAEIEAIRLMIRLCDEYRCAVHIVHLSAADALDDLREARRRGLPISVETCPHYLCFEAEAIADGATAFKCAPPLRERRNRTWLWCGLVDFDIDLVATDHSPCPPPMKRLDTGDFLAAWGGIASLELSLAAMATEACAWSLGLPDLVRWMCEGPARLTGLGHRKGRIAEGYDADLVVWDPEVEWTVDATRLRQRHPVTPYAGRVLRGAVEMTFVRGVRVYDRGEFIATPSGRMIARAS